MKNKLWLIAIIMIVVFAFPAYVISLEAGDIWESPSGINFAWIPAGTFTMGSPVDEPARLLIEDWETQHQVTFTHGFWMGVHHVTQAQWYAVMGNNPSIFTGDLNRPVEMVTWYDAIEFCNKLSIKEGLEPVYTITNRIPAIGHPIFGATVTVNLNANGYRLPTEAQWEYACRAGTTTAFNNGNNFDSNYCPRGYNNELVGEAAWFYFNSAHTTHPAGLKTPNVWGLYDMHGNVWEWCWNRFEPYPHVTPQLDPHGELSGAERMLRGGSWSFSAADLRSARRIRSIPSGRRDDIGFRLLRPGAES